VKHAAHRFKVIDDVLQVGGMSLASLVQKAGRTPFYAYDSGQLTDRVALLRQHLPQAVHLHYAIKANPMPAVVRHLAKLTDGLDVASVREMQIALETGTPPSRISFAGPGKSDQELEEAIAAGIVINLESEREMRAVARLAAKAKPRVAVRVNPDFELKSSGMKMGGGAKQFGVDCERVPEMLEEIGRLALDFQGFHIFSGSQVLKAAAIAEAQEKTFALAIKLAEHARSPVRVLNIGGGFGIPYFPGEQALDIEEIGKNLARLLPEVQRKLPQAQIVIELGRYLAGEAGIYVCKVIDRKISRGQVFLVTDGGLHHHLAASGNFGQVIRKNYPVVIGNKVNAEVREIASVVGPLCTPLDLLADKMELARAEPGDLVVVFQSGAYGLSASPTAFLSHPPAVEVLV
jgi:diaminopimelate decarboxylase